MDALFVGFCIVVAGALIAAAITSFSNNLQDIYRELKARAEQGAQR